MPNPEAARKKILATALELMKDSAVSREEHERIRNQYEAEAGRLQEALDETAQIIEGLKARTEELETKLKECDKQIRRLSSELLATKQCLEWSRQSRVQLVAQQRKR